MSAADHIVPSFARLNLPSVEEYQKRKVALISGKAHQLIEIINKLTDVPQGITGQDGSYL